MTTQQRSAVHHTFTVQRTFASAPDRVFDAFADPALKQRWFVAPEGWESGPYSLDFRVGGAESSRGNPPDGPTFTYDAVCQDIVQDERIVSTYVMNMDDQRISVSQVTVLSCTSSRRYLTAALPAGQPSAQRCLISAESIP